MQEQQLRGQVLHRLHPGAHVARLHGEVPLADNVIRPRGGEHARVHGAPLHGRDGAAVLLEVGHRTTRLQVKEGGECGTAALDFHIWLRVRSPPYRGNINDPAQLLELMLCAFLHGLKGRK